MMFAMYLNIMAAEYMARLVTPSPLPPSSIVINGSTELPNARYPNNAKENGVYISCAGKNVKAKILC